MVDGKKHGWFLGKDKLKEMYFYKLEVKLFLYNKIIYVTYVQLKRIFGNMILS